METACHKYDISEEKWNLIEPHLPGQLGQWGGATEDNRRFIEAVFWILQTGNLWCDLPPDYGTWDVVHRRFLLWRDAGCWEKILEKLVDEPEFEWLMTDTSHIKVYPRAIGAEGEDQEREGRKGGSTPKYIWPWMRMVCQSEYLLQRVPLRIARIEKN